MRHGKSVPDVKRDRILVLLAIPDLSMTAIASRIGVSQTTVSNINDKYKIRQGGCTPKK